MLLIFRHSNKMTGAKKPPSSKKGGLSSPYSLFGSDVAVVVVGSVAVAFVFVVDDAVVNPSQNKQGETVISFQLLSFFIESLAIFLSKVLSLTSFFATDKYYSFSLTAVFAVFNFIQIQPSISESVTLSM